MLNKRKNIKIFKTIITNLKYYKQIKNNKKYIIIIEGKSSININKTSKIILNGNLRLGNNSFGISRETSLMMEENSEFVINGSEIGYDCDIQIFKGAKFFLGNSYINNGTKIGCKKSIVIGDGCAIGTDVTILDSDFHKINGKFNTEGIVIENHVWIGTKATILSGVKIGEGSVIAANSLVNKDVPPHTLVGGIPAKVLKENVTWGG